MGDITQHAFWASLTKILGHIALVLGDTTLGEMTFGRLDQLLGEGHVQGERKCLPWRPTKIIPPPPPYQFSYPVLQVLLTWGDMQALTFCFGCSMSHRRLEMGQWRHA